MDNFPLRAEATEPKATCHPTHRTTTLIRPTLAPLRGHFTSTGWPPKRALDRMLESVHKNTCRWFCPLLHPARGSVSQKPLYLEDLGM